MFSVGEKYHNFSASEPYQWMLNKSNIKKSIIEDLLFVCLFWGGFLCENSDSNIKIKKSNGKGHIGFWSVMSREAA